MTKKEEKELLIKDLCARLPYGVKCVALLKQLDGSLKSVSGKFKGYNCWAMVGTNMVDINTVVPYLRPMSSMTEEEENEYKDTCVKINGLNSETSLTFDWLNAHHFDYRDLIEKGLALEAPEGMYKF